MLHGYSALQNREINAALHVAGFIAKYMFISLSIAREVCGNRQPHESKSKTRLEPISCSPVFIREEE